VRQYLDNTAHNVKGEGGGMSDQKDDLDQVSTEQGNEDPATRSEEQLASTQTLEQPKEEEKDLGITESLNSKWLSEEAEKELEPKSTTTDLSENEEEKVEVATGDHELKVLPDNEEEEKRKNNVSTCTWNRQGILQHANLSSFCNYSGLLVACGDSLIQLVASFAACSSAIAAANSF